MSIKSAYTIAGDFVNILTRHLIRHVLLVDWIMFVYLFVLDSNFVYSVVNLLLYTYIFVHTYIHTSVCMCVHERVVF